MQRQHKAVPNFQLGDRLKNLSEESLYIFHRSWVINRLLAEVYSVVWLMKPANRP